MRIPLTHITLEESDVASVVEDDEGSPVLVFGNVVIGAVSLKAAEKFTRAAEAFAAAFGGE